VFDTDAFYVVSFTFGICSIYILIRYLLRALRPLPFLLLRWYDFVVLDLFWRSLFYWYVPLPIRVVDSFIYRAGTIRYHIDTTMGTDAFVVLPFDTTILPVFIWPFGDSHSLIHFLTFPTDTFGDLPLTILMPDLFLTTILVIRVIHSSVLVPIHWHSTCCCPHHIHSFYVVVVRVFWCWPLHTPHYGDYRYGDSFVTHRIPHSRFGSDAVRYTMISRYHFDTCSDRYSLHFDDHHSMRLSWFDTMGDSLFPFYLRYHLHSVIPFYDFHSTISVMMIPFVPHLLFIPRPLPFYAFYIQFFCSDIHSFCSLFCSFDTFVDDILPFVIRFYIWYLMTGDGLYILFYSILCWYHCCLIHLRKVHSPYSSLFVTTVWYIHSWLPLHTYRFILHSDHVWYILMTVDYYYIYRWWCHSTIPITHCSYRWLSHSFIPRPYRHSTTYLGILHSFCSDDCSIQI